MLQTILEQLKEKQITTYLIKESKTQTAELFFIRKRLDMRREKDVTEYSITVYHDFVKENTNMRGSSSITLPAGMTASEIGDKLASAYYAAGFVCNPFYELPEGSDRKPSLTDSQISHKTLEESASIMTEALFHYDTDETTFLNSAELFLNRKDTRIVNSQGIDVSFITYEAKGEFVAQCTTPADVETYKSFSYDDLNTDELKEKVKAALEMTRARAKACTAPAAGTYSVILSDSYVKTFFSYYIARANAAMIYPKYSSYSVGTNVQGENVTGETLNITLKPIAPYSEEGIFMTERPLLLDGTLKTIHGDSRFCRYLNEEPTGSYRGILVKPGTTSLSEMKAKPYLHIVNFSDFQMDAFTGHFGGEIRLAFLYDGNSITPVTGGSINGSILDCQKNMIFSSEEQTERDFCGPAAILLSNIPVAGV